MLLEQLKQGVKNTRTINYPGTNQKITVRVLTDAEEQQAELAAERFFIDAKIPVAMHNIDDYQLEKTTRKLFAALSSPDGSPLCRTIDDFKRLITRPERDILVGEYNDLMDECSPSAAEMADDEFFALVDDVKKKPLMTIGSVSNLQTLRRLCMYLATQPQTSPEGSGSTSM